MESIRVVETQAEMQEARPRSLKLEALEERLAPSGCCNPCGCLDPNISLKVGICLNVGLSL
jgi:hypothetical protein